MNSERAQEIRARVDEATPGPWGTYKDVTLDGTIVWRIGSNATGEDIGTVIHSRDLDAWLVANAPSDLADLLAERERMGHELAWWDERFPCDGMCSPNDGPQEDCSRHGRAPKDLWDIVTRLTAENNSMRAVVEAAASWVDEIADPPSTWAGPSEMRIIAAVRAYRATTGEAGQ